MNIVVEIDKNEMYPESIVPDSLTLTMTSEDKGVDGTTLYLIYLMLKEAVALGADIAAIAGFIYLIIKDYRAKVSIDEEVIDSSKSEEEIADVIEKKRQDKVE